MLMPGAILSKNDLKKIAPRPQQANDHPKKNQGDRHAEQA